MYPNQKYTFTPGIMEGWFRIKTPSGEEICTVAGRHTAVRLVDHLNRVEVVL